MSITDELRKWGYGFCGDTHDVVTAIADRIDAEHEKAEQDLIDANNQMEQLCECSIRLPVDAEGKPIRVGDVLTDGEYTFRVDELAVYGDGSWSIRNEDGNAWAACDVTHHYEPTVEDVLRALTDEVWNRCCEGATASDSGIDGLVAECAAKLRLAGENA